MSSVKPLGTPPADQFETVEKALVGVISDTHGLLRRDLVELFRNVDAIIHAGDVCGHGVIEGLRAIAPLYAVAGNCDSPEINPGLPGFFLFTAAGVNIGLIHNIRHLDLDPVVAGIQVIIHGHTHIPEIAWRDGVLYLNPGSAGPCRFGRPATVAFLKISVSGVEAEVVELPR
jgi:putative phosphoesterase